MHRPRRLYWYTVCDRCCRDFTNRRQLAFALDLAIVLGVAGATSAAASYLLRRRAVDPTTIATLVALVLGVLAPLVLALRDGLGGRSVGRSLFGLRVIDTDTGLPIGASASVWRNLATLVPVLWPFIAVQMFTGFRMGDRLASTKVVWDRHAQHPIFGVVSTSRTNLSATEPHVAQPATTNNPFEAPHR
jgi:RDD family